MAGGDFPMALGGALQHLRAAFAEAGLETPELDARLLLEWAAGADRLAVLASPGRKMEALAAGKLEDAMARRLNGEPVHRIIGTREFYGLEFALSSDTLEPRPDTESLVELVLKHIAARAGQKLHLLDLGTGSGIIAVSLLAHLPKAAATATDISSGALVACQRNAEANGVADRLAIVQSDWFEKVTGQFDLIVSNPPYIPSADIIGLSREVRDFDPLRALDGGADGLDAYRSIAAGAAAHLAAEGLVALETGHNQHASVTHIFENAGFALLDSARDLGGRERALLFAMSGR